jgi:hypothetical protein
MKMCYILERICLVTVVPAGLDGFTLVKGNEDRTSTVQGKSVQMARVVLTS